MFPPHALLKIGNRWPAPADCIIVFLAVRCVCYRFRVRQNAETRLKRGRYVVVGGPRVRQTELCSNARGKFPALHY